MKIAASLANRAMWAALPRDGGGAGGSFAQLLEAGADARQVLGGRALGFAEAGLLGVHFAQGHQASSPAPAQATALRAEPEAAVPEAFAQAAPEEVPGSQVQAAPAGKGAGLRQVVMAALGATGPHGHTPPQAARAPTASLLSENPREAAATTPLAGRIAERLARLTPQQGSLRVRLREEGGALAVFVEGIEPDVTTTYNLDQVVREIVAEYGMSTSRVLVTPVRNPGYNSKMGN